MHAESGVPAAWLRSALDPTRAFGPTPVSGTLRVEPEDFVVDERLGFEPDGGESHRLLRIEKIGANTLFVARALAARAGRPQADVGFAGQKDRRAVARQWFSVPATRATASFVGYSGDGFRVLSEHAHSRKLRRGALVGNRFSIRVRGLQGDPGAIEARIARLAQAGLPNYFGTQRFGREGSNLRRVHQWLETGRLPRGREQRAFLLSSARALVFNAVLDARVAANTWNQLLPGEVINLAGSRSVFTAEHPDETLHRRLQEGDLSPTGPLCGAGGVLPGGEAGRVEAEVLSAIAPLPSLLAAVGLRAERRALIVRPTAIGHRLEDDALALEFDLPRGVFATSVLREVLDVRVPESDED